MADPRLDPKISLEATGGPVFNNVSIVADASGRRQTIEVWPRDLRVFKIGFVVRWKSANNQAMTNIDRFRELLNFFRNRRGSSRSFRFKDWTDYQDWGKGFVQPYNGVRRLVKKYTDNFGNEYVLPIYKPVLGTIVLGGGSAGAPINYDTGVVSSGSDSTWTGEYDLWCHFTEDRMEYRADPSGIIQWNGVGVMEDVLDG